MEKVLELAGGIEKIIGPDDIVVIKPNIQWWNQGAPNIAATNRLIECIMDRHGGFYGEVVIAENNHRGAKPWEHAGWSKSFIRNSDLDGCVSYSDLGKSLRFRYGDRFSVSHWIDISAGGKRVFGPGQGNGYVICDGTNGVPLLKCANGASGDNYRETVMSYPVFFTDRGTVVDLKNGIWRDGSYTRQPLRLINLAALNHHSFFCGTTSAVKNYYGISDLSGGSDPAAAGRLSGKYFNFHSFAFNKSKQGPVPGILGAAVGMQMNTIRKADLNITTAEWVGLSTRTETPAAHTRCIVASGDPVVLDYHASRHILYPNSKIEFHNPANPEGPLYQYLKKCAETARTSFGESRIDVRSYSFSKKRMENPDELDVHGDIAWGSDLKMLAKYAIVRFGFPFLK